MERISRPHQYKNLFRYSRIIRDMAQRIDLAIDLDGKEVEARLPKQYIDIYPHDREVFIPEWLCEKQGLV